MFQSSWRQVFVVSGSWDRNITNDDSARQLLRAHRQHGVGG
jgi:hypothetical protein